MLVNYFVIIFNGIKSIKILNHHAVYLKLVLQINYVCLVGKSCLTLCNPMDYSTPSFPVYHQLPELLKLMSIESVMPSNHLILCHPLLLLPSIFPSIRVFSNELALRIRWPKYWSFSFSISPSNEYSGSISFRGDWFDLLAVQRTLKGLSHLGCYIILIRVACSMQ